MEATVSNDEDRWYERVMEIEKRDIEDAKERGETYLTLADHTLTEAAELWQARNRRSGQGPDRSR